MPEMLGHAVRSFWSRVTQSIINQSGFIFLFNYKKKQEETNKNEE